MSLWRFIIALCAAVPAFLGGVYLVGRTRVVFVDQLVTPSIVEAFVTIFLGGFLFAWLALWLVTERRPSLGVFFFGGAIWTLIPFAMYKTGLLMILETDHWVSLLPVMLILAAFAVFWLSSFVYRSQLRHAAKVSVASGTIILMGAGSIAAKTYTFYHPPLPQPIWNLSAGDTDQLTVALASLNERTDRVRTPCSYRYGYLPLTKVTGNLDRLTLSISDHYEGQIKGGVGIAVLTVNGDWVCENTIRNVLTLGIADQGFEPQAIYVLTRGELSVPGVAGMLQLLACPNGTSCSANSEIKK